MYVRMMVLKCEPCKDGLRLLERDRIERPNQHTLQRGVGLPPTYLPTFEKIFRDRHLGSEHSVSVSQQVYQGEI